MGQANPAVAVPSAMLQYALYLFVETMPLTAEESSLYMGQANLAVVPSAMLQNTLYLFIESMPLLDDKCTVDVEGQGHDSGKHRGQHGEHQRLRDLKKKKRGKKNTSHMGQIGSSGLQILC